MPYQPDAFAFKLDARDLHRNIVPGPPALNVGEIGQQFPQQSRWRIEIVPGRYLLHGGDPL
jgi:hypothetical protein